MTNEVTSAPTEATAQAGAPAGAPQPSGIQIADLQSVLNIIDLASKRGAFGAAELTQVGSVADKISNFLSVIAKQQKEKADAEAKAKGETAEATAPAEATAEASDPAPAKE
jgi:hypothetical protein